MTKFSRLLKKNQSKYIFIISLIFLLFFVVYISTFIIKPNIQQIPYSTVIYDKNNVRVWEIIKDNKYRHEEVLFWEIPEFTKKSIIALEDKTFFSNSWIDYKAIFRAFLNNFQAWSIIEWWSTISTQVIRNNYWLNKERTFLTKIKEFYLAIALNNNYSKEDILSNYLWNIYYWYLNYWLKSASNYYFDKSLSNLTKAEQIALIALPKNPKKYDPYINKQEFKNRFKNIANYLYENKIIQKNELNEILNEKLEFNENHDNKLPYIVDYFKGLWNWKVQEDIMNSELFTTIDYNLTKKISEISRNSIIPLMWKNVKDYSVIIIDRKTNSLLTMIWWINYYWSDWQVNMTTSPRQVWSTIKPFTYVLAFKNLWYVPSTTITDLPVQFQTDLWYAYNPKNYSLDYKWEVTVAEALSQSINIPALKVAEKVGVSNLLHFLKKLWITTLTKDENYYWLALTLWVWEISLYELTRAFTIFANDGELCDVKVISNTNKSCKKIIEKKYTDMINEILTNRYYKINAFPINWNLDFPDKNVFLKTWTSRNFKDNWTVWYTDNYIIWVWAWNKDGSEMKWVSWASWAWEIFKNIVDYIEKDWGESEIKKIEKEKISYLEITSPLNNSKYKIEETKEKNKPKIKLEFSTSLVYDKYKWFINEKEINNDFYSLEIWQKEIKIVLYDKVWKIIKEETIWIYIE